MNGRGNDTAKLPMVGEEGERRGRGGGEEGASYDWPLTSPGDGLGSGSCDVYYGQKLLSP